MEKTLGKRIVAHRKRLRWTQEQLAEKLGVTAQAVSKWENDQSCPDITMLPHLAALFGTTTDELLGKEKVHEGKVIVDNDDEDDEDSGWESHWDGSRKGALTVAIYNLLLGGLFLLVRAKNWDVSFWSIAWPSAMLVFGFSHMLSRPRFLNITGTVLGGYFLINNLGIFSLSIDKSLILPILGLIFGLCTLFDALRKPNKKNPFRLHKRGKPSRNTSKHFTQEGEHFETNLSFGETNHTVTLPRLSSGNASVNFGEMTLDLTHCGEIADGCYLELDVNFGEMNLKLPKEYGVEIDNGAHFGDISTHGHPEEPVMGTIRISGNVSFGELDIYYV